MNKEQLSETKTKAQEYSDLGMNKYFNQDYQGAIEDFDRALKLNPDDADVYGNLSVVRYKIGDTHKAIEDCKLAAVLYSRQGKIKQHQYAIEMEQRLLQNM